MFITIFHKIAKYEKQPKSHHSRGDKWNAIYSYSGILYNDFLKEYIIASYNMSESYSYYIKKKSHTASTVWFHLYEVQNR